MNISVFKLRLTVLRNGANLQQYLLSPPSVKVVNIGGDYEIGHSVRRCVCPSFCVCVPMPVHMSEAPYLHNDAR